MKNTKKDNLISPCNKLLQILAKDTILQPDTWSQKHHYKALLDGQAKKWIANITPSQLLNRTFKEAVESIATLSEEGVFYKHFPDIIESPNYGDLWGRLANYIEINNRAIAEMHENHCKNGILSSIKLLPAIPPSAKSWANCVILSQIFPNIYGDGYNKPPSEENSIYGIKLNAGYSENIIATDIQDQISPEEQFMAFNDFAHFRGLKTGFRMVISEDQLKIARPNEQDESFCWAIKEHEELFIQECVKLMNLGFEAMFIDSAKHIGGYDCPNYAGVGGLPEYPQMQYILQQIRERSNKTSISFVGEKSSEDFQRYKNMGLTSGTAFVNPDDFESVKYWSEQCKYSREYAPGVEVSNDNDEGGRSFEERLHRIHSCLFGFYYPSDKLPSFMQMEDLFPLRYDTSTHHLMMSNPSYSTDGTPKSHFENLFSKADGKHYNHLVGELFAQALGL